MPGAPWIMVASGGNGAPARGIPDCAQDQLGQQNRRWSLLGPIREVLVALTLVACEDGGPRK